MGTVKRKRSTRHPRFAKWRKRAKELGAERTKVIRTASVQGGTASR